MELLSYLSSLSIPNLFSRMPAAAAQGITAVTRLSSQYPARLRHTLGPRCPAVLFAKGEAELLSARCISRSAATRMSRRRTQYWS